jgi:putative hydrolase of the HAD superfamily
MSADRHAALADVEAVLLDVGGVFYLPDHERVQNALARFDVAIAPEALDRAHFAGVAALAPDVAVGSHEDGHTVWHAYNRAYARVCGVPDDLLDDAVPVLLDEFGRGDVWTRQIAGASDALAELAARGLLLAVVSNADGTVERDLRADGICQVGSGPGTPVGAILDSAVVGVAKPDPAIFRLALDRLGVAPERAIHVGDTPAADVAGARAAGIRPVLVDPYDLHLEADCRRVASLAGVVELLAT